MDDLISRQAAIDALNGIINRFEQILRDIRESKVDDSVCGMCEYDGAFVGQSGDWCNECPGFEKDDCFKLSDDCRKRWLKEANLPSAQPEQQWIPCSERLPEDIRPVIVTWKNTDPKSYYQYIVGKHFTGTACYKNGKWYWYSSTTEDMLAEYGRYDSEEFDEAIECIAWMPLPEAYKEDDHDEG